MNSELISFESPFEAFIDCDTQLLPVAEEIACDDKHVTFYIDGHYPRHFRRPFLGATSVLVMRRDLCFYLQLTRQFVDRGDTAPNVLAMLHTFVPPPERRRVYLDQSTFAHLFSSLTKHRVADQHGNRPSVRYNEDKDVGTVCRVQLSRRRELSDEDMYIAHRLKGASKDFVAVYEGRGWLWIVSP